MGGQVHKANTSKCFETNVVTNLPLLSIRAKPLGPQLPSPTMLLFNDPIQVLCQ